MLERFADDARRAVVLAQDGCRRQGHPKIRSAHLALGALAAGEPLAGAEAVPALLAEMLGTGDAEVTDDGGGLPFAGSARRVVVAAHRRADAEHRPLVDRFDLLLGAFDEPAVAGVLHACVDLDGVRDAAVAARAQGEPNGDGEVVALLRQVLSRLDAIEARLDGRRP